MRKFSTLALIVASLSALTGCNTIEGMGRDVSAAGKAVSDGARSTRS